MSLLTSVLKAGECTACSHTPLWVLASLEPLVMFLLRSLTHPIHMITFRDCTCRGCCRQLPPAASRRQARARHAPTRGWPGQRSAARPRPASCRAATPLCLLAALARASASAPSRMLSGCRPHARAFRTLVKVAPSKRFAIANPHQTRQQAALTVMHARSVRDGSAARLSPVDRRAATRLCVHAALVPALMPLRRHCCC